MLWPARLALPQLAADCRPSRLPDWRLSCRFKGGRAGPGFKRLPYTHCAISFQPFEDAVSGRSSKPGRQAAAPQAGGGRSTLAAALAAAERCRRRQPLPA